MNKSSAVEDKAPLERWLAVAKRNWLIIAISVVVVPLAAYGYSKLQTPTYTASASLLFASPEVESRILGLDPSDSDPVREAATNLRLASLEEVAARTAAALPAAGLSATDVSDKVSVSPEGESELIAVSANDESPEFAATLANEFSEQFIAFSRQLESAKVVRAQKLAEAKFDELSPPEQEAQVGVNLLERIKELETIAAIQTGKAELAQPAIEPSSPSSPRTSRNVALGLLIGILLGVGLTLLREQFDRRVRDAEELEALFGLSVLGTIPESEAISKPASEFSAASEGLVSEAFRMLRANLRYINIDRDINSLLFTSGAPQDGKTMVAWNVARTEAEAGKRVLCIEADLRRPTLGSQLGVQTPDGLGLVLAGAIDPDDAIQIVNGVDLLPAGPLPPNPGELLESERMGKLLSWAESHYDLVIIDTPPASVVADPLPLMRQVGGVVIVARLRRSTREGAEQLREQLAQVHAPLLGIVVNGAPKPPESSYYQTQSRSARFEAHSAAEKIGPKRSDRPAARGGKSTAG